MRDLVKSVRRGYHTLGGQCLPCAQSLNRLLLPTTTRVPLSPSPAAPSALGRLMSHIVIFRIYIQRILSHVLTLQSDLFSEGVCDM
jgi:hypothetical protein